LPQLLRDFKRTDNTGDEQAESPSKRLRTGEPSEETSDEAPSSILAKIISPAPVALRGRKFGVRFLQKLCREKGIPISCEVDKILPGWIGRSKGIAQILFERGLLGIRENGEKLNHLWFLEKVYIHHNSDTRRIRVG